MSSNIAMFRQFLTGGDQNPQEPVVPSAANPTKPKSHKNKIDKTQDQENKIAKKKCSSDIIVERQKRPTSNKREVSVYRSKTGSFYATKTSRQPSYNIENDNIKRQKEKSPQTEQRTRKRSNIINKTTIVRDDKHVKNEVQEGFGWCQIVYYILTLQFLRDLVILAFNICKQRVEQFIEHYFLHPIRKTRDRIESVIDFIRTWYLQKLDIYLIQPIDYIRNSYLLPIYRHSYNFIVNIRWCVKNIKKYCVILIDVLCLRIAKLAENFRHYFAVIFLTKLVPEHYSMAYHLFALFRLVLGTLYPAYASFKAVRTKNVREYVSILV